MYSMLTINTPEWRHWRCSGVFIVDFEDASPFFIVFIDDLERVNDCWGCHLSWQLILIYRDSFLTGMTRSDTAAYLYFLVHVLSSQTCQLIGEENFLSRPKFWQRTPECVKASIFFRCQLMIFLKRESFFCLSDIGLLTFPEKRSITAGNDVAAFVTARCVLTLGNGRAQKNGLFTVSSFCSF